MLRYAVQFSLLAFPRFYRKPRLFSLLLELGLSAPPSLRPFATQGLPPLWWCWGGLLLAACVCSF